VMKVYGGETAPECKKEDLVPPPADSALVQVSGAVRSATQEDPDEEVTMIPVEEDDVVTVVAGDASEVFTVEAGSTPVDKENEENPDSQVQALVEIRTKLRFIGNQVGLRNPEMVPTLVQDINDQKEKHPDAKFAFCVHVGTSASENIKTSRPGFMEGRVQSLVDALAEQELEVESANAFEHFQSTRFAGLVMKVYGGETAPECKKEDLVPPPADSSLVQVSGADKRPRRRVAKKKKPARRAGKAAKRGAKKGKKTKAKGKKAGKCLQWWRYPKKCKKPKGKKR